MNYRHIYHAGNICDVVKHTVLTLLLTHLQAKESGFAVLDTHAGTGRYDLEDTRAQKTKEAEEGACRFFAAETLPELAAYNNLLREMNPDGVLRAYPGSPMLTRSLLRPQDRLMACELHPEDSQELKRRFRNDPQVHVHCRDGYEALTALMPPQEKRGIAFIDPPYETPDEFTQLVQSVAKLYARWMQGQVAIWYPIKERPAIWRFHEELLATKIDKLLCAEFVYAEEVSADRLNGCGFIFVNPPWGFDEMLNRVFPQLHARLQTPYQKTTVNWLREGRA